MNEQAAVEYGLLLTVLLVRLIGGDTRTMDQLFPVCCDVSFFYLTLWTYRHRDMQYPAKNGQGSLRYR
ncbi:uncharacterized protein BDV17DRAFT_248834 [Aspergillus undulatus]|uniref:uncharacterized protein n=1 Tax=Aspergillus undulatus TaxID=1810928 RepID=UPI003CCDC726